MKVFSDQKTQGFPTLFFLLFILSTLQVNAQGFKAYLAFGSNMTDAKLTQSGKSQLGTRIGLNTGLGVSMTINKRWETNMELLYSKNGYYVDFLEAPAIALDKITLHYIEAPLALAYRFNLKENEQKSLYKHSISGGIAYARLFKHKITGLDGTDLTEDFRFKQENALLFHIAATSLIRKSLALNVKGTVSTFGGWTFAFRLLYYI